MKTYFLLLFFGTSIFAMGQTPYHLSEKSTLQIEGTSTVHDWTVTAHTLAGSLQTDDATLSGIDFQVAVADIKSERGATMDKKMHAALQKEKHPEVLFKLDEAQKGDVLHGTLRIAGQEQAVTIPITTEWAEGLITITGEYPIALKDFQIEPPTAMFGQVVVGDRVTVKFDLIFEKE